MTEISDEVLMKRAHAAVRLALEKHKALGVPSAVYDRKDKMIYALNPDGTRTPIAKRSREGRYSEWSAKKA